MTKSIEYRVNLGIWEEPGSKCITGIKFFAISSDSVTQLLHDLKGNSSLWVLCHCSDAYKRVVNVIVYLINHDKQMR